MAILRGGVRIGGFDVRLGLPRDRSLDNVENDKRFRRPQGPQKETTMGRIHSYVNEAEGFARKAKFYVEFYLPKGASPIVLGDDLSEPSLSAEETLQTFKTQSELVGIQNSNAKRVNAFCNAISMPDRDIQTLEVKTAGPARKIAYDYKSADITATFYSDKFLRERTYFETWQAAAFSTQSHNFNFYDNYVSDINIFQLGSYASKAERDDVTYAVKLFDCFPKTIGVVDYAYADTNTITTFNVTFTFRYWVNYYFHNKNGNFALGEPNFRNVDVKSSYGAFGGLMNRLPPELRRAGTQVLEGIKRRIPIGGVTGGRVFPPFGNLPPLNL
jgi:hypothetical protein